MHKLGQFLVQEDGPTTVEYAVLLASIILVCIGAITLVGGQTFNYWSNNKTQIESVLNRP
jgi:pilus assembly protein Flp/PilA